MLYLAVCLVLNENIKGGDRGRVGEFETNDMVKSTADLMEK